MSWLPPGRWNKAVRLPELFRSQCPTGGTLGAMGLLPPLCKAPAAQSHRKTGPLRVRSEFVGAGADYHLPEGNSCRRFGRDLGGWTTDRQQQQMQYAERDEAEQPGGSHASH